MNSDRQPDLIVGEKHRLRILLNRTGTPRITQVFKTDVGATIRWIALPGKTYRVQFKERLTDDLGWTDLDGEMAAATISASKTDTNATSSSQRIYRIVGRP